MSIKIWYGKAIAIASGLFPISGTSIIRGTAKSKVCYNCIVIYDNAIHEVSLEAAWVVTIFSIFWNWLTGRVTSINQPFCCTRLRIPILLQLCYISYFVDRGPIIHWYIGSPNNTIIAYMTEKNYTLSWFSLFRPSLQPTAKWLRWFRLCFGISSYSNIHYH